MASAAGAFAMSDRFRCRARLTVDHGCRLPRRIGSKIFIADLLGQEKFPPVVSLGVTLGIIAAGFV